MRRACCLAFVFMMLAAGLRAQPDDRPTPLALYAVDGSLSPDTRSLTLTLLDPVTGVTSALGMLGPNEHAGWSPDGRYVWIVESVRETAASLRLIDTVAGTDRVITEALRPELCTPALNWAPDGRHMLIFEGASANHLLLVETASGTRYVNQPVPKTLDPPQWSSDGRFVLVPPGQSGEYIVISRESGEIVHRFESATGPVGETTHLSPDSRYLTYAVNAPVRGIERPQPAGGMWIYDIAADEARLIIPLEEGERYQSRQSVFSPDSRFLATIQRREDRTAIVRVVDLSSADPAGAVSGYDGPYASLRWSPESRRLLLGGYGAEGMPTPYFLVDTEDDSLTALRLGDVAYAGPWTADGGAFYAVTTRTANGESLLRYDVASGTTTTILADVAEVLRMSEANGWLMVATADVYEPTDGFRFPTITDVLLTDGTREVRLDVRYTFKFISPTGSTFAQWSPDGQTLLLASEDGTRLFDAGTGAVTVLPLNGAHFWSPDSRFLAINQGDWTTFTVWDVRAGEALQTVTGPNLFIGWQGGSVQGALVYCGIG